MPRAFFKTQPIPQIRHYLGEKVAVYFAWLGKSICVTILTRYYVRNESICVGFYTKWLHISTIVGLLIFTVGPYTLGFNLIE